MARPGRRNAALRFLFGDPYDVLRPDESVVAEAREAFGAEPLLFDPMGCGCALLLLLLPPYLLLSELARLAGRPVMLGGLCIVSDQRVVLVEPFRTRSIELSAIRSVEWRRGKWLEGGSEHGRVTLQIAGSGELWQIRNLTDPEGLATAIEDQIHHS